MIVVGLCVLLGLLVVQPRGRAALGRYRNCYERDECVYRKNAKRKNEKRQKKSNGPFDDVLVVIRRMRVSVVSRTCTTAVVLSLLLLQHWGIGVVSVGSAERGGELATPRLITGCRAAYCCDGQAGHQLSSSDNH